MWDIFFKNLLVIKEVVKKLIIEKLIPSIVDNFHRYEITITIQLDYDSSHNVENEMDICR